MARHAYLHSSNAVLSLAVALTILSLCPTTTLAYINVPQRCPEVVRKTCDIFAAKYDDETVEKCKAGMLMIWKRAPEASRELLFASAEVEAILLGNRNDGSQDETAVRLLNGSRTAIERIDVDGEEDMIRPVSRPGYVGSGCRRKGCPGRRRRRGNVKRPSCKGANAAGLACGAAGIALGLLSFGTASVLLGVGCTVAAEAIVGICGV